MKFELETIYVIICTNGRKFCAKCTEMNGEFITFESSRGLQSQHKLADIVSARKVM